MNRESTRRGIILYSIANGQVILEYKAVSEIARIHKQQAWSYLKATGLELAIVINFGAERVQSSRKRKRQTVATFSSLTRFSIKDRIKKFVSFAFSRNSRLEGDV